MESNWKLYQDLETILYSREQIAEGVKKLGQKITQDYQGKDLVMICILKGATPFFADLMREIDLPLTIDFMVVSSYGASTKTSGEVKLVKDLDRSIQGKDVLVVEDIVDTGMTLSYLKRVLEGRQANSVAIASLLDKPSRRKVELDVQYSCFEIPDAFVVGYGLDFDEKYRNLPDVGVLKPEKYL
ncbi:MAG: hypoxanthine phosphoribosyltransferase [Clostridia bacterium]|nr:hypoxanthine phosphoribosyltransferase [Clostridia bacterium]